MILFEFLLPIYEWKQILPLVQSVVNHSNHTSVCNLAPIATLSTLPPDNSLRLLCSPQDFTRLNLATRLHKICEVYILLGKLDSFHKDASESRTKIKNPLIQRYSHKTHVRSEHFSVYDFFLIAKQTASQEPKLKVPWIGSQLLIRVQLVHVFEV